MCADRIVWRVLYVMRSNTIDGPVCISRPTYTAKKEANIYNGIESSIALFISFLVNLFVISVFASGFSNKVHHGVNNNTGLDPIFNECNADR